MLAEIQRGGGQRAEDLLPLVHEAYLRLFAAHIEDVAPEEVAERGQKAMAAMG